jgi:hypothetical protein
VVKYISTVNGIHAIVAAVCSTIWKRNRKLKIAVCAVLLILNNIMIARSKELKKISVFVLSAEMKKCISLASLAGKRYAGSATAK